jgi:ubiquinone/menaquinone biosynthesis C-methylase UbiE
VSADEADRQRAEMRARWERGSVGWARHADSLQAFGMPVSAWLIEQLRLQPGQHVLDLAAGPGDTGFMAAELVAPGGRLTSSDASDGMLRVARSRAAQQGIDNAEFRRLELEWIDLETASVDAVVCRWGLMFASDPSAALQEVRRVLKPGGRVAMAVWDSPGVNPWATVPTLTLVQLGHIEPPDPTAPGMFVLADRKRLQSLLEEAGFTEVVVDTVDVRRPSAGVEEYFAETADLNPMFLELRERLSEEQWDEIKARVAEQLEPFVGDDGSLRLSGRSLVAAASA